MVIIEEVEIDHDDAVWMLADLILGEGDPVLRGVPRERLEAALCARYPAADIAAVFERLPEALREREGLQREEAAMADHHAEQRRLAEEWAALKPAREAAREAYRRVAGFDPAAGDLSDDPPIFW